MALDSREKRMNAARVGRPWLRARHAVGATDQQSRIASGHGYGGNALSPAVGGRIMSSLVAAGGLAGRGGLVGLGGGLAG